jgi:hypothetical protein
LSEKNKISCKTVTKTAQDGHEHRPTEQGAEVNAYIRTRGFLTKGPRTLIGERTIFDKWCFELGD